MKDIFDRAKIDKKWGNEYHLLALCSFLNKKLYMYGNCTKDNKFVFHRDITENELLIKFDQIGQHLFYLPIENQIFKRHTEMSNIYGHFKGNHYVSLIPNSKKSVIYETKNNLFQF